MRAMGACAGAGEQQTLPTTGLPSGKRPGRRYAGSCRAHALAHVQDRDSRHQQGHDGCVETRGARRGERQPRLRPPRPAAPHRAESCVRRGRGGEGHHPAADPVRGWTGRSQELQLCPKTSTLRPTVNVGGSRRGEETSGSEALRRAEPQLRGPGAVPSGLGFPISTQGYRLT